jgi:hypothetical protein
VPWLTSPLSFLHLQEPRSTVLAAIGQADAGANGRGQNGFSALSGKSTSAGLDGNFKRSVGNLGHDVLVILEGVSGSLLSALLLSQQRQWLLRSCTQQVPILPSNQSPLARCQRAFVVNAY